MNKVGELFEKPIDRTIEEVIKVDQTDESSVRTEIEEYIATDSIREQFVEVYREFASGPARPRMGLAYGFRASSAQENPLLRRFLATRSPTAKLATQPAPSSSRDQ